MKLDDAIPQLRKISNIPFKNLYSSEELSNIIIAKGNTGKLLEKLLGLPPGISLKDFEDGELKTNKCYADGKPRETMFITQISNHIDELLQNFSFANSWLYEKIKRLLYVPVVKDSKDPNDWYFLTPYKVEISFGSDLYKQLEYDYKNIITKMLKDVNRDGFIHTSSGVFIQIRTKDSIPYNPIFSSHFNKYVSNKNFAFYFKKEFMKHIQSNYKSR